MTTNVTLESALLYIDDSLLEDMFDAPVAIAASKTSRGKRKFWRIAVAACCCLCLLGIGISAMGRLDYHPFLASCGSYPGQIMAGDYYYFVPHQGVYRYDPESNASQLILHTFFFDNYTVGGAGIFYQRGRSVYLCEYKTGERRHLYTAPLSDTTHIALDPMTTGELAVTCYNKHEHTLYQVIFNGMNGGMLHVTEPQSYRRIKYSEAHHALLALTDGTVGRREIELVETDAGKDWLMDVRENGQSLLPPGATVSKYSTMQVGLSLWFTVYYEDRIAYGTADYLELGADGSTQLHTLPEEPYCGGDGAYLFYPTYDNSIGCVDIATGESWVLTADGDTQDVYDAVCDGEYLYTTAPWTESQSAWRILRDADGRPVAMESQNPALTPMAH